MNPYVSIIRPSVSLMSAVGALVGALIAGAGFSVSLPCAIVAVFLISGGGVVLNDYYDIEIDKINAPHRVLPSGSMSKKAAICYSIALFVLGLVFSYLANLYCLTLAALNVFLEFLYARNLKRTPLIGNAVDSWFVASTFLFGAMLTMNFGTVWMVSLLAFIANMGREIFGDIEDVAGDEKLGLKTLPIISMRSAVITATAFIISAVILSFLPYVLGIFGLNYLLVVAVADVLFIVSLFQKPRANQKTTKIAMFIALVAFLVGII